MPWMGGFAEGKSSAALGSLLAKSTDLRDVRFDAFPQTCLNVQDRGVGRLRGSGMTQGSDSGAVFRVITCTPCRLGIHSCCSSRMCDCQCDDQWHAENALPSARYGSAPPTARKAG